MKCDELESFTAETFGDGNCEVYEAVEVDAAIAELKQKLENVQASMYCDVVDANMENFKLERELRHHKYKRCMAMAFWCSAELGMLVSTWEFKIKHYKKWQNRWLKIAEQFKEAERCVNIARNQTRQ